VAFSSPASSAPEGAGTVGITVALTTTTGPLATAASVGWATANGSATAGSDYTAASGTVTFPAGSVDGATQVITVGVTNDARDEPDETFLVTLSAPSGATLGTPSMHTVTILDDDPPPSVSIGDVAVTEGDTGTKSAVLNPTLSAASGKTVTVNWATADGTASTANDYVAASGTATFSPGVTARTVTITVIGDTRPEADETFFVNLSGAVNATIADGQGVGTIQNDDPPSVRVFVSVKGSDVNDCRNTTTPCRTLGESVSQVAPGGEVIVLDTGSYGGLTIGKAVTIETPSGVVAFAATPVVVSAGASDAVVLRGLTLKAATPGSGTGVQFTTGRALYLERCVIDGWGRGIDFAGDGDLYVTDTTVRNSASAGLRMAPPTAAGGSIDRSRFEGTASGCGVDALGGARATVRSSVASGNATGFCASAAGAEVSIQASLVAHNAGSGVLTAGGTARVTRSLVTGNGTGLNNSAGTLDSLGNNLVQGNGTDTSGTITPIAAR
jgi:hypothetical protein